jgi:CheY-like chemotaxis protein
MNHFAAHTFLLIDDSEIDSIITSKILQMAGLPKNQILTKHANPALEFLKTINKETYSITNACPLIILLDIHMPDMNGFQFLEQFDSLSDTITEYSKIFLLTSSIDPIDIERADLDRYVVRVLNKPLNTEELLRFFE